MSVIDEDGQTRTLLSLWEQKRIVILFTRHMGCRFCREQIAEFQKIYDKLYQCDVIPIIITIGLYTDIIRFKQENSITGMVYVDATPDHPTAYQLFRLNNGKEFLFKEDSQEFLDVTIAASKRAESQGFSDGGYGNAGKEYTGDVFQVRLCFYHLYFTLDLVN